MSDFNRESKPQDANEECVGPQSEMAGKASSCEGCPNASACASGVNKGPDPSAEDVKVRMAGVKKKILVLSGKGGVGKSTVSTQLSFALSRDQSKEVGLLDVDICGPSIPRMTGLVGQEVHQSASGWSPVYVEDNLGVMSIGFMLPKADDAIIWRGPRKVGLIKQFLTDVVWNDLDFLVVDTPPGTSDEHISIVQLLKESNIDGAVVVTTPQEVSMADVRKELNFCKKTNIPVLGVVENMADLRVPLNQLNSSGGSGSTRLVDKEGKDVTAEAMEKIRRVCPEVLDLSLQVPIFTPDGAGVESNPQAMARKFGVPYLGALPMDSNLTKSCEQGLNFLEEFPDSTASGAMRSIVEALLVQLDQN